MVGMTWEELEKLYDAVETAVQEKKRLQFPENVFPVLQVGIAPTGPTFTIPGLLWMDDERNIYQAWMQIELHGKRADLPGLYVVGTKSPDGFSSGDISMIKKENRYRTII